jgi:hypothetical protein
MASSSVSQDDIENNYERLERRSRIRTARARQINPQVHIFVVSVADSGCLSRIRIFFLSRIRSFPIPDRGSASKNLSIFTQKQMVLSSRKYDPCRSSRSWILTFYPSRIQGSKRHWIPDPDPQPLEPILWNQCCGSWIGYGFGEVSGSGSGSRGQKILTKTKKS